MATTKPPAKKTAPAKAASTAVATRKATNVVSITEALKAQAAALNERVAPATGNSISIQGKEFRLPDGVKTTDPIEVVVVDFAAANSFYEGKFDAKNIVPPNCFAVGTNPLKLVPTSNAPAVQSTDCASCPMNEFGSDGAGKACKNTRILGVLPPDGDADTPLWRLSVPPTSTKNWDNFVRQVSAMFQMPPVSVITTISFDENFDYPVLKFGDPQPNPNLEAHFGRQGEAQKMVLQEPDFSNAAGAARAPAKKVAGARGRR